MISATKAVPVPAKVVPIRHRRRSRMLQRLLIQERALTAHMREERKELSTMRRIIREGLEEGQEVEPGLRTARIEVRKVLVIH